MLKGRSSSDRADFLRRMGAFGCGTLGLLSFVMTAYLREKAFSAVFSRHKAQVRTVIPEGPNLWKALTREVSDCAERYLNETIIDQLDIPKIMEYKFLTSI